MAVSISRDQFISTYKAAPRAVRDAMESVQTVDAIQSIGTTYSLHVDVVGQISKLIGYMLIGLLAPNDFYQNLIELRISPDNASAIVKEVNERIFLPLRDHMRQGASAEPEQEIEEPEAEYDPSFDNLPTQVAPPTQPRVPVMQVMTPEPVTVEQKPAQVQTPAFNLVRPDALATAVQETKVRTMQSDIAGLQHPSQMTPASIFRTASVPFTSIPAAPRSVEQQPVAPQISQAHQPTVPQPIVPSFTNPPVRENAPVKDYGSDPYRESV